MSSLMQFEGVAAVLALIGLITFFLSFKLLASRSWLKGWLQGNIGIFFILVSGFLALCVLDVRTYRPMFDDRAIATINFQQGVGGKFQMYLVDAKGKESRHQISGDTWFFTINRFQWSKRLSLGLGNGYRFSTVIGKYADKSHDDIETTLDKSSYIDVWRVMKMYLPGGFLATANTVTTNEMPLVDGAMYEVVPLGLDVITKPLNEIAKRAVTPVPDTAELNTENQPLTPEQPTPQPDGVVVPIAVEPPPVVTQ